MLYVIMARYKVNIVTVTFILLQIYSRRLYIKVLLYKMSLKEFSYPQSEYIVREWTVREIINHKNTLVTWKNHGVDYCYSFLAVPDYQVYFSSFQLISFIGNNSLTFVYSPLEILQRTNFRKNISTQRSFRSSNRSACSS